MFSSANAFHSGIDLSTLATRARVARKNQQTVTNAALTRTVNSGVPWWMSGSADGMAGQRQGRNADGLLSGPAATSPGLMSRLQAQVREMNPLVAGAGRPRRSGVPSLSALQGQIAGMRHVFRRLDGRSRFLMAASGFTRGATGFEVRLFPSAIDLQA